MLTIIGLGLGGPNSITMDGVIALSMSEHIFYETYTSPIHSETLEWIEMKSQRKPIHLSRNQVEEPKELVDLAKETNPSQSSSTNKSLTFLEPLALSLSPTIKNELSCL